MMYWDEFPGCCAINIVAALGSAEGDFSYSSDKEFFLVLKKLPRNTVMMATSIQQQRQERKWLNQIGFRTYKCGHMYIHFITGNVLEKNLTEFFSKKEEKIIIKPPFNNLIRRSDIKRILFDEDGDAVTLNDFYQLNLPDFVITEEDVHYTINSIRFQESRILDLRGKIYKCVLQHRKEYEKGQSV